MSLRIFAVPTRQGTAVSETMLCSDDMLVVPALDLAISRIDDMHHREIEFSEAAFIDVSDNQEAACIWCGRRPGE